MEGPMVGQTISHYKVLEKLGEGGMGVVYKAHDTRLNREVALKFLPTHLAASEQDKARFVQEAQSASSINHPNICTIHDIQEHDGSMFIVMEYVNGQTLRDRLTSHIPHLKSALDIGIQIADGLAAAHEKGIVHRDIKPENIMVRKDGIVQIMDFGLAKLRGVSRLTREGSTVGTVGYMSPEQVQGLEADHRSDIFSLGVLLYEMFAGQPPFRGVHETAVIYEIVNVDAPPMSAAKTGIDPALDAVVLECLEKDPVERYQSAAEVSKALRRCKRESDRSVVSRVSRVLPGVPTPIGARPTERRAATKERLVWTGLLVTALAVIVYLLFKVGSGDEQHRLSIRFTVPAPEGTVINESVVSPDGRVIAFTTTGGDNNVLWVRRLDEVLGQPVQGTDDAAFPFWSPDSRHIAFFADGKLKKVEPFGGFPVIICDAPDGAGGSWNAEGEIILSASGGIHRVSAAGGTLRQVTFPDASRKENSHRWPSFLPDGKHFLFVIIHVFDEDNTTYIGSVDDTSRTALITSEANVVFAYPSNILFLRNRTLMSQAFDPAAKMLIGDPRPMMVNVGFVPRLALGDFSYSKAGILTTGGGRSVNRQYGWFDRSGKQSGSACPPGNYFDIALSPDGDRAAVQRSDVQTGNSDIWIVDLQRSLISRLTFEPAVEDDPAWSADGKDVYYSNAKEGTYNIYRKAANGVGSPRVVTRPGAPQRPADWSRDGKYLLFETDAPRAGYDIWVLPADTTEKPFPFLATPFTETYPRFSPDGNWVAYASDESGRSEIYVQSFPMSGGRWQVSTNGGSQPRWRQDGRELFYVSSDLMLMAIEIGSGSKFEYGQPVPLFKTRIDDFGAPSRYVPVQNGQKFLINIPVDEELANPITVSVFPFEDGTSKR